MHGSCPHGSDADIRTLRQREKMERINFFFKKKKKIEGEEIISHIPYLQVQNN